MRHAKEEARIGHIAHHFDVGMGTRASEEEQNGDMPLNSCRFAQLRGHWAKLLGAATLDRLRHGAYRLILDGESYRTPRPFPEERK
jgi:hypothetical protein